MRLHITAVLFAAAALLAVGEDGFTPIFNGSNLDGWMMVGQSGRGYEVADGLLVCPAGEHGNLFTKAEYGNFILRFDFRLEPGANNGIGIRAPFEGDAAYQGMEIQVLDDDSPEYRGKIRPAQHHGSIYDVVAAEPGHLKPAGEWNTEEIRADGRHIKVTLNGAVIVDANLDTITDPEVLKRHPGLARATGHIGLLGHTAKVEFRSLRIKRL